MNRPHIQPVIYLWNREPEIVNTNPFTSEVIDQVNRATALIDEVENNTNPISDEIDSKQIRKISLLSHVCFTISVTLLLIDLQIILDSLASS